ncbi:MAG: DUF1761 family protein [Rhodobacter sp.]|nr:DUF1761 family protein [Rhodobacter sp.]
MEYINVIAAGVAAWIFGAVWYMTIAKTWMQASGLTEEDIKETNALPYVVSLIGAIVVAGMMRHILAGAGIDSIGKAILTGVGMGAFIVSPWMINNVLYSNRDRQLIWMDCGYPVIGMGIIGFVLALF